MSADSCLRHPLGDFLAALAAGTPTPGVGAAAAVTVALAAGLTAMAARFSDRHLLAAAAALTTAAEGLRQKAARYADDDAAAFGAVQAARRLPAGPDEESRRGAIRAAVIGATEVPLAIAEAGAEVAGLAGRLAVHGNPTVRGDAMAGALLAEAGTRAAATLVAINVASGELDGSWTDRARAAARAAADATRSVVGLSLG